MNLKTNTVPFTTLVLKSGLSICQAGMMWIFFRVEDHEEIFRHGVLSLIKLAFGLSLVR